MGEARLGNLRRDAGLGHPRPAHSNGSRERRGGLDVSLQFAIESLDEHGEKSLRHDGSCNAHQALPGRIAGVMQAPHLGSGIRTVGSRVESSFPQNLVHQVCKLRHCWELRDGATLEEGLNTGSLRANVVLDSSSFLLMMMEKR